MHRSSLCLSCFQKLLTAGRLDMPRCTPAVVPWLCLASHMLRRSQLLSCRKHHPAQHAFLEGSGRLQTTLFLLSPNTWALHHSPHNVLWSD